ncbi:MAG: DUF2490 domain-containing protein [Pyrinomonadaceae bacterium]
MKLLTRIWLIIPVIITLNVFSLSQTPATPDDEDIQSWNEVQLTVPLSKRFDFITGVTARFDKNITRLNNARYMIGYVWKPNKAISVSPFYQYIQGRNSAGRFRIEHRLHLRGVYKFPVRGFGLSHRSQFEYRLRSPRNTWRYRPSLTFEKEIPKTFIPDAKFYITEEPFYDSATSKFSRNRFSLGIVKTLSKSTSLDLYYLRQNDGFSHPGDLNVIGTSWKIKL